MLTRNFTLTEDQSAFLDGLVAEGRYPNANEALRAGLRLLERDEAAWAEVKRGVLEGIEQVQRGQFAPGGGEAAMRRAFARAMDEVDE